VCHTPRAALQEPDVLLLLTSPSSCHAFRDQQTLVVCAALQHPDVLLLDELTIYLPCCVNKAAA
jgi:hypothetical protein